MARAAIVTGASSGIGLGVARALIEDGYYVALAARRGALLDEIASELGERAIAVPTDVRRQRDVDALAARTLERFGRLDVAVASAGTFVAAPVEETDEAGWDRTLDVNLKGTYWLARATLPMLRDSRGYLIGIASVSGTIGQERLSAYCASKWGMRGFLQSVLREARDDGVRVTAISPGAVATPMSGHGGAVPELIAVEDIVETVRWLLRLRPVVQVRDVVLERTVA